MTNYVLAFRGVPDRAVPEGAEQAWGAWFGQLGPAIADRGNRVGNVKRLDAAGSVPGAEALSGYVVVSADSMESAVTLAKGCPGLATGVSVEVAEIIDM
jgi:YCII-related domain